MIGVGAIPSGVSLRQATVRQSDDAVEKTAGGRARADIDRSGFDRSGIEKADVAKPSSERNGGLTDEQLRVVSAMKARDREVRAHEEAHKAVGGRYAGAISYDYQQGPDGQRYVVSGSVPIDTGPVAGDPKATIAKMEIVIAAALAPAEPSPQDRAVAQQARSTLSEAEGDLRAQRRDEKDLAEAAAEEEGAKQDAHETADDESALEAFRKSLAEAALAQNTPYAAVQRGDETGQFALIA